MIIFYIRRDQLVDDVKYGPTALHFISVGIDLEPHKIAGNLIAYSNKLDAIFGRQILLKTTYIDGQTLIW